MNGTGLLVLLSLFGQVGLDPTATLNGSERDYGWQISKVDGVLEYIIQLSPQTVDLMQSTNQEKLSDMPPALVGRATRTVVRIGTAVLPRTPSLAEISKMPRYSTASDLTAQLSPGRFSDLESNAVLNVQQYGLPPTASNGSTMPPTGSMSNLIDQAAAALPDLPGTSAPSNSGMQNPAAGTVPMGPPPGMAGGVAASSGFPNISPQAAPTLPYPNSPAPGSSPLASSNSTLPPMSGAWNASPPASSNLADLPTFRGPPTNPTAGAGSQQAGNVPSSNLGFGIPPNGQRPGQPLADAMFQNQNSAPANNGFPPAGNSFTNLLPPQVNTPDAGSVATQAGTGALAGQLNGGGQNGQGQSSAQQGEKSPHDTNRGSDDHRKTTTADNFVPVFLLLSLVVNIYLVTLIRKLLTRYRSLLSSVRSQTA